MAEEATSPTGTNTDAPSSDDAQPEGDATPMAGTQESGLQSQILDSVSNLIDRKFSEFAKELTATEPDRDASAGQSKVPLIPEPENEEWQGHKAVIQGLNVLMQYVATERGRQGQQEKQRSEEQNEQIAKTFLTSHSDLDRGKLDRVYKRAGEIFNSKAGALEAAYRELYPQSKKPPVVTEPPKSPAAKMKPPTPSYKSKDDFRRELGKAIGQSI